MAGSDFIERIRRGSPGLRLILVPKQSLLNRIAATRPGHSRVVAAEEVKGVAQRFDRAVDPTLKELRKIGLSEVSRNVDLRQAGDSRRTDGVFERLSLVRAIAVRVEEEKKIERILEAANPNFEVVLDVRTESDHAMQGRPTSSRSAPREPWPDWTGVREAINDNIRGAGVIVGALDTGVDADHREFKGKPIEFRYIPPSAVERAENIRDVRGFDTDGHGTHVCGIIAGKRAGLVPEVNLHVAAVIESETLRASLWRTVYGLDWMFRLFIQPRFVNVPCVINLSLCFFEDRMDEAEIDDWKLVLGRAIEDLHSKDALVVAAAGNRGKGFVGFPASFDNVLAVGAVDKDCRIVEFSGAPTPVAKRDIYGCGVNIISSFERDRNGRSHYRPLDGTSMAAPYVTGLAAMLRQTKPGASAQAVKEHLLATAIEGSDGIRIARFVHWR